MTIASNKTRRHAAALLFVPLAVLVPARADGQVAAQEPASAEQIEAARSLYHAARDLHQQGKLKEAIALSLEAYRTAPTPVTARQAGRWLLEAGRLVEARDILSGVAAMPVSPRESDKGRDARQESAALATELEARIPKVAFAARPNGIEVLLDGRALSRSDGAVREGAWQAVDPGAHVFTVRSAEKTCATINVTLVERQARTIDLHEAAPACGASDATVPRVAASVPPGLSPRAGDHDGDAPSGRAHGSRAITITQWSGVAVASAGVVALGIGGYVALRAKSDYDSVAAQCTPRGCTQEAFDQRRSAGSRADVASVVVGLGAVAIASGIVLWIAGRANDAAPVGTPRVAFGPTGIELIVQTR